MYARARTPQLETTTAAVTAATVAEWRAVNEEARTHARFLSPRVEVRHQMASLSFAHSLAACVRRRPRRARGNGVVQATVTFTSTSSIMHSLALARHRRPRLPRHLLESTRGGFYFDLDAIIGLKDQLTFGTD